MLLTRSGCGCSLKTGTIVIATLQALCGFSVMVSEALAASRPPPPATAAPSASTDPRTLVQGRPWLCAALSVAGALQLVLSVLLVFGADYEKPRLVKPWVVFSMVATTCVVTIYFGLAVLTFVAGAHRKVGVAILVGILCTTALSSYFILVVHSFYRLLVERSAVPCIV